MRSDNTPENTVDSIEGCEVFPFHLFRDERGSFSKPFAANELKSRGIGFNVAETFFSASNAKVLRGFHFQIPPFAHNKIVACLQGRVVDVVVDLRKASTTYGKTSALILDATKPLAIYIPSGLAHAFYTYEENSVLAYWVDRPYSAQHDVGIHWNSCGFEWPDATPIISRRDAALPTFPQFQSPF